MDLLYPFREVAANYQRESWWKNRAAHRIIGPLQEQTHSSNFRVMDEDWDVLIVLDGCRRDLFEEVIDTSRFDEYDTRYSAGSATNEWSAKNFSGQALTDTVYVTGNPVVSREVKTAFHAFIEVWRSGFDQETGTVPPEPVTEAAIEAHEQYPDKRLIVHYLQPHYPFIGYPDLRYATFGNTEEIDAGVSKPGAKDVWEALDLGLVDRDRVWEAYGSNLQQVMDDVDSLLEATDGKRVVTSDHGNLLGERVGGLRLYGHPPYIYHPAIREVPWAVVGDSMSTDDRRVEADVEEQLESLGYA